MLVILKENVDKLGRIGDVVKVSDGYARNFLIPRQLGAIADERNVAQVEHAKRQLEKKRLAAKESAETLAKKLNEVSCTISRKVGDKDHLFGSVGTHDISEALKKAGFDIEKRTIHLEHPIKTLGVHPVEIKLQPEVVATVKVWVVKEE